MRTFSVVAAVLLPSAVFATEPLPRDAVWRIGTGNIIEGMAHPARCAFSRDGSILAVGRGDGSLQFWDVSTPGQPKSLRRFRPKQPVEVGQFSHVALSPDGRLLACTVWYSTVFLLDPDGKELARLGNRQHLFGHLSFSPDGKTLLACEVAGDIRRLDTATLKEIDPWKLEGGANQLAYSPDGKTVALAGSDQLVHLWDAVTGKPIRDCSGHRSAVEAVCFSADGKQVASLAQDGTLRTWDSANGKEKSQVAGWDVPREQQPFVYRIIFGADGQVILVHTPKSLHRLDVATGKRTALAQSTANYPLRALLSPDGRRLLRQEDDGYLRLLDAQAPATGPGGAVAFSTDGKLLAVADLDASIRLWDTGTRREIRRIEGHTDFIRFLLFTPKGDTLVSASNSARDQLITLWDVVSGKPLRHFRSTIGAIRHLELSPDGKRLLAVTDSSQTYLWEAETGRRLWRASIMVWPLFFSPDGKHLIGPQHRGGLTEWNLEDGSKSREMPPPEDTPSYPRLIGLVPDETRAMTLDGHGQLAAWDIRRGTVLRRWSLQPGGGTRFETWFGQIRPSTPQLSPDGRLIAFPAMDGSLRLVETCTGGERRALTGHQGLIRGMSFSKDGRYLATGSADSTVIVWDLRRPEGDRPTADEMAALWTSLAQPDAERGDRALRRLATLGPALLPELRKRLASLDQVPADIAKLIEDLSSDRPRIRRRAQEELEKYGEKAERAVRKALDAKPALEERRRLEEILEKVTGGGLTIAEIQGRRIAELIRWLEAP